MSSESTCQAEDPRERLRRLLRQRIGSTGAWHPLSSGQDALWFLWQLAPDTAAYSIAMPFGVRGGLDERALQASFQKLTERHGCLNTEFRDQDGQPQQRVRQDSALSFQSFSAADWSRQQVDEAMATEARKPFDLESDARPRLSLWRANEDLTYLLLVVHHIVCDLWSLIVLMDELSRLYGAEKSGAEKNGETLELGPLPISHEDYVRWQRRWIADTSLEDEHGSERQWRYWREQLAGELPVLDLPTDHPRPPKRSFRGGTVVRRLDAELSSSLKQLAQKHDATLFMVLLAAYQVLLYRGSGQESLMIGSPTSGRRRSELMDLVGDFINMVPLRSELSGRATFPELLQQTRSTVIAALKHQDFPFSLLVERLQPSRDLSRSPIFQTTFVLQRLHRFEEMGRSVLPADDEPAIEFADLMLEPIALAQQDGQFDLNLEMKEDERGRLAGAWKYDTALFEAETIEGIAGRFEILLRDLIAHPQKSLAELRLLSDQQSRTLAAASLGPVIPLPEERTLDELFQTRARSHGSDIAVSEGDQTLTYRELNERVDGMSRRLVTAGVGLEVLVAFLLPRNLDFVTAMLAVSRAGGAFLPLDPRHPLPRLAKILDRSGTPLVLSSAGMVDELTECLKSSEGDGPTVSRPRVVLSLEALWQKEPVDELPEIHEQNLAYAMFTSGSTGEPKGVMVEHRGMINHVLGKLSDLEMGADCALAQNGPQSFDIVVWQCLASLVVGGRIVVFPDHVAEDPELLWAEVERRGVTVLQVVPSMLTALLVDIESRPEGAPKLSSLRWLVPTGEALPTELCRRWLKLYPDIPVLNTYGSTECSDDQCHYPIRDLGPTDQAVATASIGTPIQNLSAYVLGETLELEPAGVVGELYVGGIGVGRGYLNDPARTAAAFVPDPYGEPGSRIYRTQDSARRRAEGPFDFLGRVDHMIKLRGFRIEPGEIVTAINRHDQISEAAVIARDHPSGERRLVAYVVAATDETEVLAPVSEQVSEPSEDGENSENRKGSEDEESLALDPLDLDELHRFLAASLPRYMVPSLFIPLDAMPLTANGKLDMRRLPLPEWTPESTPYVAPATPTEETLASIWCRVLKLERVSTTEDFFAIGGDSILSIQIVSLCRQAGLILRPADLFIHPTIIELGSFVDSSTPELSSIEAGDSAPTPALSISSDALSQALLQVEFDD